MWFSYDDRPLSVEEAAERDRIVAAVLDVMPAGSVAKAITRTDPGEASDALRRLVDGLPWPGEPMDIRWAAKRHAVLADAHRWLADIAESRTLPKRQSSASASDVVVVDVQRMNRLLHPE